MLHLSQYEHGTGSGLAMPLLDQLRERLRFPDSHTDMGGKYTSAYPSATSAQIRDAEDRLGFRLPELLRDIYLNVANGGFGPGYGLLGVADGHPFSGNREWNLVRVYENFRKYETRHEPWGEKLLPICHWGCCYFSYIDCALPSAPVLAFSEDNHGHGPWGCAFGLHSKTFDGWMQRWADGENLWETFNAIGEPIFWFQEHPTANDNAI